MNTIDLPAASERELKTPSRRHLERVVRPGDQVTKNHVRLTVHFVREGQVFWVKYKTGVRGWDRERGCPRGYMGNFRCPIKHWIKKTADAKYKPAGSNKVYTESFGLISL